MLRRLADKTRDINQGTLRWPGNPDPIEIVTISSLNDWLIGQSIRVAQGEPF